MAALTDRTFKFYGEDTRTRWKNYIIALNIPLNKWWDVKSRATSAARHDKGLKVKKCGLVWVEDEEVNIWEIAELTNRAVRVGTTIISVRFRRENLPHSHFDILSDALMADVKSEFHRFLDVLAPQIKILNRQTMSDVPVCDVVLNLKHLLPPSPCPGDLATRIFQTHYLDQLLLELPPYECFNVIRPNNTALTANEYYARIEQLVKMKCTQPQFEISISAPIPLNLESLLETLRWAGSLTKLHIECEELSDGARASLLELIKDSTVEEYPLPQSVNYPEIVKAIKKRSKQNEPGWGWFS